MTPVVLVRDDEGEWEALYIDGRLVCDGHSLDALTVVQALDGLQVATGRGVVHDWDTFPTLLVDFPEEVWVERP